MEPVSKIRASFRLEKEFYDDGEIISVVNTTKNAFSFYWEIGDEVNYTDKDPVFSTNLKEDLTKTISIALHVYGGDGEFDSCNKTIKVSKRIFVDFAITQMSKDLRSTIVVDEKEMTYLVAFIGPVSNVDGWSPQNHALPLRSFSKNIQLPYDFNLGQWQAIAMNNEEWYLRLSTQVNGQRVPQFLKEFRFNPTKEKSILVDKRINKFVLADDQMEVEILFEYTNV
jgi:hypothetical protein